MAVISTDRGVNDRIKKICATFNDYFVPQFFSDADEALEFIKYELPEINVINFSDRRIDIYAVFEAIRADPWLHFGGIIGVCSSKDVQKAQEAMVNSNVVSLVRRAEFVGGFSRVLRLLIQNRQILFQRDLQNFLLHNISGNMIMDNDPYNVGTCANIIGNYLFNSNYIGADQRDRVHVALFEMLMNAVEHGNCAISYEEKTAWLDSHGDILDLIRRKCIDPRVRARKVHFSYRITPERSWFTIRDEGQGFDWRSRIETARAATMELHGRGIGMTGIYADTLSYNETGNQVSFEFVHQGGSSANILPGAFSDQEEVVFEDGEVIIREGEESNFLYYIVSGTMSIYSGGLYVSRLTADDVFLGEMSFLLSNKRSATVVARGRVVLIQISKNSFVNIIKAQPHYGIFLARLLAARIERQNTRFVDIKTNAS